MNELSPYGKGRNHDECEQSGEDALLTGTDPVSS